MTPQKFFKKIELEKKRFFPEARIVIVEEFPFYIRLRIAANGAHFIEIRFNSKSLKKSFALIQRGRRIAGFDNLAGWHMHPCGTPNTHRKITAPSLRTVFRYFRECL